MYCETVHWDNFIYFNMLYFTVFIVFQIRYIYTQLCCTWCHFSVLYHDVAILLE